VGNHTIKLLHLQRNLKLFKVWINTQPQHFFKY